MLKRTRLSIAISAAPVTVLTSTRLPNGSTSNACEKVTGRPVPVTYGPRRAGDAIALYANPALAKELLGWEPTVPLHEGLQSTLDYFKTRSLVSTA